MLIRLLNNVPAWDRKRAEVLYLVSYGRVESPIEAQRSSFFSI